jgi:hypothetical protein
MKDKKNEEISSVGGWDWMFSDREIEEGETYDLHWLFNRYTGNVKMVITKRLEMVDDKKERIVRE